MSCFAIDRSPLWLMPISAMMNITRVSLLPGIVDRIDDAGLFRGVDEIVDEPAHDVSERDMDFLDARGVARRHDDRMTHRGDTPAALAEQRASLEAHCLRRAYRLDEIARVAARRYRDEDVPGPRDRLQLANENVVEAVVVA